MTEYMKKHLYILASAMVALSSMACNNQIDNNTDIDSTPTEGLSFTVNPDAITRMALEHREDGKWFVWEGNETLLVSDPVGEGQTFEFKNSKANRFLFTCNDPNVRILKELEENYEKEEGSLINCQIYFIQNGDHANGPATTFAIEGDVDFTDESGIPQANTWLAANTVIFHFDCGNTMRIKWYDHNELYHCWHNDTITDEDEYITFAPGEHYICASGAGLENEDGTPQYLTLEVCNEFGEFIKKAIIAPKDGMILDLGYLTNTKPIN